jgi:hypothetical protein
MFRSKKPIQFSATQFRIGQPDAIAFGAGSADSASSTLDLAIIRKKRKPSARSVSVSTLAHCDCNYH